MQRTGDGRLLRRVERHVDGFARDLWPPDGRVLVAVSGGPDSTALLLILTALAPKRGLTLTAAYFDHALRGAEASRAELAAVASLAARCDVPLVTGSGDVRGRAAADKLTLEEAARRARYDFLAQAAEAAGISLVATGHTADDQSETVLMHIVRGAGLTGVAGMSAHSRWPSAGHEGLSLVRPLLQVRRADTEAYCLASGVEPLEDGSNRSPAFLRNRVRAELLPALREYNPAVDAALVRLADSARADLRVIEDLAAAAFTVDASGAVAFDRARFRALPEGLRPYALRAALLRLCGDLQGFSQKHLRAVEALTTGAAGGRSLDLPRAVVAISDRDSVVLRVGAPAGAKPLPDCCIALEVPGEATLGTVIVAAGDAALDRAQASVEADADAVGQRPWARAWRPGDRMQPLGMSGTRKLQDIFVDAHVPRDERKAIPVFGSDRGILWLAGLRLAEWARPRTGHATTTLSYRREG